MADVVVAATRPALVELEPGTFWWCRCGCSENQPFCDGAHAGTGFEPLEHVQEEVGRVAFCQCKHTANEPLCDGSHKRVKG